MQRNNYLESNNKNIDNLWKRTSTSNYGGYLGEFL